MYKAYFDGSDIPARTDTDVWRLIDCVTMERSRRGHGWADSVRIGPREFTDERRPPLPVFLRPDGEWDYGREWAECVTQVWFYGGVWHWGHSSARTLAEAMRFAYEDAVDHGLLKPHVPDASSQKPIDPANPRDVRIVPLDAELTVSAHGEEIATVQARLLVVVVDGVISAIDLQRGEEIASLPAPLQGDGLRVGARVDEYPALKRVMPG
jgi:hypothetical protein